MIFWEKEKASLVYLKTNDVMHWTNCLRNQGFAERHGSNFTETLYFRHKKINALKVSDDFIALAHHSFSETNFNPSKSDSMGCTVFFIILSYLKGLSNEIDFENIDKNVQNLALLRDAAGFWIF